MCQWNYFFQFRSNFVFSDLIRIREIDDFELEDIDDEEEYDAAADAYEECLDTRLWNRTLENE